MNYKNILLCCVLAVFLLACTSTSKVKDYGKFEPASLRFEPADLNNPEYLGGIYYIGIAFDYVGNNDLAMVTGTFFSDDPNIEFAYPENDTKAYLGPISPDSKGKALTSKSRGGQLAGTLDADYPLIKLRTPLAAPTIIYVILTDSKSGNTWKIPVELMSK